MNARRRLLLLGALAAPVAYLAARRPRRSGGGHNGYFQNLQRALREAGLYRPTLVIDRQQLAHNLGRLKANLPKNKQLRVVAKSLPSLPLIREVRAATGTDRLMLFHQPHLNLVAREMPDARILLGKPMPVGAARRFYAGLTPGRFDGQRQVEWLADTGVRVAEYRELAAARPGGALRLNLELDVGLHRGGFRTAREVAEVVRMIAAEPRLEFSGFMGYEAHASRMPDALGGPRGALDKAMKFYAECVAAAQEVLGARFDPAQLTLNAGGSSTYELYDESMPCNELAIGSALVKPSDFDTDTLADHQPACFIATPVLKALDRTLLPGLEAASGILSAWDPNSARTFFLYGGNWLASPVSPPGLQRNAIWGHSSNQDMLNGSRDMQLGVDDFVFLRPHQSESVFLQFGDLAVYEGGRIAAAWPVFPEGTAG